MEDVVTTWCGLMSRLPISEFDGYQLGSFTETDTQNTDTYSTKLVPRWYGHITERSNDRTGFVVFRDIDFSTLREGIYQRLNSIVTIEDFAKRPVTISETEFRSVLSEKERKNTNSNTLGGLAIDISGFQNVMSSFSELAVVTTINRYAYRAPPELKLQAGVEYAVWMIRQPANANRANGLVRSGAATLLDAYKYRGI